MRYPRSGTVTSVLTAGTTANKNLLGSAITAGRQLWLRQAFIHNYSAGYAPIFLCDVSAGATGPTGILNCSDGYVNGVRYVVATCSGASQDFVNPMTVNFPAPGLKFTNYCTVLMDGTCTATAIIAGGFGYEE